MVVLLVGHFVHSKLLLVSEKNPRGHIVQFKLSTDRPNPALHLQSLNDCEYSSDACAPGHGRGIVAPVSQ
jgi:hypothetical protein